MLIPSNSRNHQMTHEHFKFMFETGNFSIILRLLWHVIFLPIMSIVSLCYFFNITHCVLSEKITLLQIFWATDSQPLPSLPAVSALWCWDHELSPPTYSFCSGFLLKVTSGFSEMCWFLFDGITEEDVLASGVLTKMLDFCRDCRSLTFLHQWWNFPSNALNLL